MRHARAALAVSIVLAGCKGPALRLTAGAQNLAVADAPSFLQHGSCPQSQRTFDEALSRMKEGPPPIPGDDAVATRLFVVDRSASFDLVRLTIQVQGSVLAVVDEHQDFVSLSFAAGAAPTLQLRALVRPTARNGAFEHVTVCLDKWATFKLRATDREIPLVLQDGDDALAPGGWSLLHIDTGFLEQPVPQPQVTELVWRTPQLWR